MNVKSKLLSLEWKSYQGVDYIVFDLQPHHRDLLNSFFDEDTKKWRNKQIEVSLTANSNWHKDIFQFENWGMSAFVNVDLHIHPSLFGLFMLHSPKQEASWYASSIFARMVSSNKEFDRVPKASVQGSGLPEPKKKAKKLKPKNTMIQDVKADMDVVKFRKGNGNKQAELFEKNIEAQFPPEEKGKTMEIKFKRNMYDFLKQLFVTENIEKPTVFFIKALIKDGLFQKNQLDRSLIGEIPCSKLKRLGVTYYAGGKGGRWIMNNLTPLSIPIIMHSLNRSGRILYPKGYNRIIVTNQDEVLVDIAK